MTSSGSAENERRTTCDTSGWTLVVSRNVTLTYNPIKMGAFAVGNDGIDELRPYLPFASGEPELS